MDFIEYTLSDGTVIKLRKLKMKDLVNAEGAQNNTLRAMKLVASAIIEVNGEEKTYTYKDVAEWDVGDFQKVSEMLSEFSGLDLTEREIKKEF